MFESNGVCSTAVRNGSIVLLARLVGSDGLEIGPADVAAIEYSIFEVSHYCPSERTAAVGHEAVALDVYDVIFDSLQADGLWRVDNVGYNFRHEVALGEKAIISPAGAHIEVRYLVTPINGAQVRLRFQLKVI